MEAQADKINNFFFLKKVTLEVLCSHGMSTAWGRVSLAYLVVHVRLKKKASIFFFSGKTSKGCLVKQRRRKQVRERVNASLVFLSQLSEVCTS